MLSTLAIVATVLVVAVIVLRFAFPEQLVALMIGGTRRFCGLRLESIDVDGVTWPYLEGGNPSGDVMLLVHGFGGDKDNWPLYARQLRRNYRILAPDLPGFGDNAKNPDIDYRIAAQAKRLDAFMGALGIERFHIAGNSMGGFIALRYALDYPDKLNSLTLLNNAGVSSVTKSEVEIAADRGENVLVVGSVEEFAQLLDFVTEKPVPFPKIMLDHVGNKLVEQRNFLDTIFWSLHDDMHNHPLDDRLHEISMPTLIIWGDHDRVLDVSCTQLMKARIPTNECVVFEGVGHVPMLECPAETASAHRGFITRHRAA